MYLYIILLNIWCITDTQLNILLCNIIDCTLESPSNVPRPFSSNYISLVHVSYTFKSFFWF